MFEITILLITSIMMFVTFAPFSPSNHWISRVWEFPRVQIAAITIVLMVASTFIGSPIMCLALFITNALLSSYQLMWIFPYTRLCKKQVLRSSRGQGQLSIKIMTSNVLMPNRQVKKLVALVNQHQPDVLVTLETDLWWETQLASIHKDYPYRVNRPLDNLYGMHLYSKYPLEDIQVLDLIEKDIPSIHGYLVLNEATKIKCHFLHPAPPSPTENETSTPRDKELLLIAKKIAKQAEINIEPTIVTGDLNDVAWSPTTKAFREISGLKDPRIGRGMFNTFHANYPFLRWPLDHIFHSEHFTLSKIERMPSIGSDHFPLLSELTYEPK